VTRPWRSTGRCRTGTSARSRWGRQDRCRHTATAACDAAACVLCHAAVRFRRWLRSTLTSRCQHGRARGCTVSGRRPVRPRARSGMTECVVVVHRPERVPQEVVGWAQASGEPVLAQLAAARAGPAHAPPLQAGPYDGPAAMPALRAGVCRRAPVSLGHWTDLCGQRPSWWPADGLKRGWLRLRRPGASHAQRLSLRLCYSSVRQAAQQNR
jgi:hypothetical protein